MSRIAATHHQTSQHRRRSGQFGEADAFGQPIDAFETHPNGGVPMSTALDSAPISSGDLDSDFVDDTDTDEMRWKPRRALSPGRSARLRLAMAFVRT